MDLTINKAFQKGIAEQQSGNFREAEKIYRIILTSHPNHPDTNHNLGVLLITQKKYEDAMEKTHLYKKEFEKCVKLAQQINNSII